MCVYIPVSFILHRSELDTLFCCYCYCLYLDLQSLYTAQFYANGRKIILMSFCSCILAHCDDSSVQNVRQTTSRERERERDGSVISHRLSRFQKTRYALRASPCRTTRLDYDCHDRSASFPPADARLQGLLSSQLAGLPEALATPSRTVRS